MHIRNNKNPDSFRVFFFYSAKQTCLATTPKGGENMALILVLILLIVAAFVAGVATVVLYGLWQLVKDNVYVIAIASISFVVLATAWLNSP